MSSNDHANDAISIVWRYFRSLEALEVNKDSSRWETMNDLFFWKHSNNLVLLHLNCVSLWWISIRDAWNKMKTSNVFDNRRIICSQKLVLSGGSQNMYEFYLHFLTIIENIHPRFKKVTFLISLCFPVKFFLSVSL